MFNSLMSYLSRFSRLILVILAVLVLVVLIGFTINSAADNKDQALNTSTSDAVVDEYESQTVVVDTTKTTETEAEPASGAAVVTYDADSDDVAVVVVSEEPIATITEQGNPQNYGDIEASQISLDSSDTVTVVTVDEQGNLQSETGQVSSTVSDTAEHLPSTGLSSIATTTIGLMAVTAAFAAYVSARQNLIRSALGANR